MRFLAEVIVVGALIYLGWATPFRDYLPAGVSGVAKSSTARSNAPEPRSQSIGRSTFIPPGAWMWGSKPPFSV